MKKTVSYSKSQLLDDLGRLALMVLASVIMAVNLKSFVQAGDLVPGGFNGLTLLIQRVALRFWGLSVPFSAINFLLNAVPAVISFKLIGKRFTLFSCVVILCTSLLTDLIPPMPITDDVLLICIFGGLINGFAISLCLRGRATSGGTDFISIALSQQYDVDAWNYIFMGNVVMLAVSGALFGWDKALYSILFQFASTQVIKLLDPSGRREVLETVQRLNREKGITIVLITHYMEEAAQADRVLVMSGGKVVMEGTPKEVFSQTEKVRALRLDVPQAAELRDELVKAGIPLPEGIIDTGECAQALYELLK